MTSGPLCLPIGNGRQASRTGPGTKTRHRRLSVAPPGRVNLLYPLFLALLIVGCSSGQGHLEGSNEPILAEGWEVDEVPGKQSPAKPGLASEDLPPLGAAIFWAVIVRTPSSNLALRESGSTRAGHGTVRWKLP